MNRITTFVNFSALLVFALAATATAYDISADSIQKHIDILAADSLEGREVGEPGERKAAQYIAGVFQDAGLVPAGGDGSYFQEFEFIKSIDFGQNNRLTINGMELQLQSDFLPLKQSLSSTFEFADIVDVDYGIKTGDSTSDYNDYAGKNVDGKAVVIKRFAPDSEENPHVDFNAYSSITDKIRTALDQNAAAIIFITPETEADTLAEMSASHLSEKPIPIILLRNSGIEKLGLNLENPSIMSVAGEIDLVRTRDTGFNVVGMLPGQSDTTIILGAHFDHLGWGGPNSLYRGEVPMIHNGADDNASGTAGLLELARHYSQSAHDCHYTLIFAAFSGEEAGLLGSSHMAKNPNFDPGKVRMMLNMDMVGRLKDQENELAIMGTGTCEEFPDYFDNLTVEGIKLIKKESGVTPSDNTMFYNRGIPSLMFFTGAHQDYHRPTDDADKIDARGIKNVADLVGRIVGDFDTPEKPLTFSKTKDPEGGSQRRRFSVSLGVMPDYVAEVEGLKIDGVTPDKPAAVAGIVEGDIVIQLGEYTIGDIYEYMNALGKFRNGDSCTVRFVRGIDTLSAEIVF